MPFSRRLPTVAALALLGLMLAAPPILPAKAEAGETAMDALPADDVKAIKTMFEAATTALLDGDLDTWTSYWTEDATVMPPGGSAVEGRAALVDFAKKSLGNLKEVNLSDWTVEGCANLAVVTTAVDWRFEGGKTVAGKQMVIAKKSAGGAWKAQKVIYNANGEL